MNSKCTINKENIAATTATSVSGSSNSPGSSGSSLQDLLAQARENSIPTADQLNNADKSSLILNGVPRIYSTSCLHILSPLLNLLPRVAEYKPLPCPPEIKKNPPKPKPRQQDIPAKYRYFINPGNLMMFEYYRAIFEAKCNEEPIPYCWEELNDNDYNDLLSACETMSNLWGKKAQIEPGELLKNLVFFTVLTDDNLRKTVLPQCQKFISEKVSSLAPLEKWRETQKQETEK